METAFALLVIAFVILCVMCWKMSNDIEALHLEMHEMYDDLDQKIHLEQYVSSDEFKVELEKVIKKPIKKAELKSVKKTNKKGTK